MQEQVKATAQQCRVYRICGLRSCKVAKDIDLVLLRSWRGAWNIMIQQPEWGTQNVNRYFYESETRRIAALNEIFGDVELTAEEMQTMVWLAGWDDSTVTNMISAIRKVMAAAEMRQELPLRP